MPPEYMVSSAAGQASSSASPTASAPSPMGSTNVSAFGPTSHQQNLAMLIQHKAPTEVLVSRLPHGNGVTWIFHDPATSYVRHVNVPNIHHVAQQQANQGSAQASTSNEMVLYQPPSNQVTQHVHSQHRLLSRWLRLVHSQHQQPCR